MHVTTVTAPLFAPKPPRFGRRACHAGITLLELTVVILVLMSLISLLFVGARAWKRGSDRAQCIIQIRNVQKGVRCYANFHGLDPGSNAPNLQSQVIGFGRFIEQTPECPGSGVYGYGSVHGIETIPPLGALYMDCSLAGNDGHMPEDPADW